AGGSVRKNPKGRELGFGRGIRLTEAGRKHPMYVGKMDVFNAPTVHLDEVETLAPGSTVLSTNAMSDVQAVEVKTPAARRPGACSIIQNIRCARSRPLCAGSARVSS